jgi:hypothetical protein
VYGTVSSRVPRPQVPYTGRHSLKVRASPNNCAVAENFVLPWNPWSLNWSMEFNYAGIQARKVGHKPKCVEIKGQEVVGIPSTSRLL